MLLALLLIACPAHAHADLFEGTPEPNTRLTEGPTELRLRFTEPLESRYTRVEVTDGNGTRYDTHTRIEGEDRRTLQVSLAGPLRDGLHTVTWRILGVDGHTEGGAYLLAVNASLTGTDPEALHAAAAASAEADHGAHDQAIVGGAAFFGSSLAFGIPVVLVLVAARAVPGARHRGHERLAATAALLAGGAFLLQYVSFARVIEAPFLGALDTRAGLTLALRALLLAAAAALLLVAASRKRETPRTGLRVAAAVLAFGALVATTFSSHAAAAPTGRALAMGVDLLHQAAVGVWVSGVAILLGFATFRVPSADLRATLLRFSPYALTAALVVLLTGVYASLRYVPDPAFLASTTWGRVLLAKVGLFTVVLVLGGLTRYVFAPRLLRDGSERALSRLEMLLLAELATMALVLMLVAVLVGNDTPPLPSP